MNPTGKREGLFVTSDTHFAHKNIIEYANRPFESVEKMNELLIFYWNEAVTPFDTVIHCGDLVMGGKEAAERIIPRLNGRILLVRGNHEYNANFYKRFGDKISILPHGFEMGVGGFGSISSVKFSHKPLPHKDIPEKCLNLHGHLHKHGVSRDEALSSRRIDVGIDAWGFTPQTLGHILRTCVGEKYNG